MLPARSEVPDVGFVHANTPSQAEGGSLVAPATLVDTVADALGPWGGLRLEVPRTATKLLEVIGARALPKQVDSLAPVAPPPASARALQGPAASAPPTILDGTWKLTFATPLGPPAFAAGYEVTRALNSPMLVGKGKLGTAGTAKLLGGRRP